MIKLNLPTSHAVPGTPLLLLLLLLSIPTPFPLCFSCLFFWCMWSTWNAIAIAVAGLAHLAQQFVKTEVGKGLRRFNLLPSCFTFHTHWQAHSHTVTLTHTHAHTPTHTHHADTHTLELFLLFRMQPLLVGHAAKHTHTLLHTLPHTITHSLTPTYVWKL